MSSHERSVYRAKNNHEEIIKMNRLEINQTLNRIFADVFDDPSLTVNDSTSALDIEDWDSLSQITLVSAIEDEFNIQFNLEEVNTFKNVGEMMDCIEKHLSK